MKRWFEVSREGLKELQMGKPKHFIARELIQNAWDEQTKVCSFGASWDKGKAIITVEDDNPTGFKDISDAFTLFKSTSKRSDPTKRGRFNIGEKQVLSICEEAVVATTKGTVIFDKQGRRMSKVKIERGSKITVWVKMTSEEFHEMMAIVRTYLIPKGIRFLVNGETMLYRQPYKTFQTTLLTEREINGSFAKTRRITDVCVHKSERSMLYELGLPVTEIDCQFSIDVQQKIPLSIDRDTVPNAYLKALYAEVLNVTYGDIEKDQSSATWVRLGMTDERVSKEAVRGIVVKRFGDKVAVANPFDPISVDDALSHGFNVVHGSELSKEEWENIRKAEAIKSSSELFGQSFTEAITIDPDENMEKVKWLALKIAKTVLGIDLTVRFVKSPKASVNAQFGDNVLTFNVSRLGKEFFSPAVSSKTIDLIIHELGHYAGNHTEASYHELLTKLAGELVTIALVNPAFYKI